MAKLIVKTIKGVLKCNRDFKKFLKTASIVAKQNGNSDQ